MSRISVVIPTYNRAAQVVEAVRSVTAQTFPPAEIIVVDDGSTDCTAQLFASAKPPVRYIRKDNNGVSSARNAGVKAATSEWVAFLDSDDLWRPEKLERQIKCVNRTGAKVCYTGSVTNHGIRLDDMAAVDPTLGAGEERYFEQPYELVFRHRRHPLLPSLLVRKDALERAGLFDETLCASEDTKLIYQLALSGGAAYINEPLVTIERRRKAPGLSDTFDAEFAARRLDCSIRVVTEAYQQLIDVDAASAQAMRSCIGYFSSRRAEIACVLGHGNIRELAKQGLRHSDHWHTSARCLLLWIAPGLCRLRLQQKWKTAGEHGDKIVHFATAGRANGVSGA